MKPRLSDTGTHPFNGCQTVPGITPMHIISARDDGVKLWENVFLPKG